MLPDWSIYFLLILCALPLALMLISVLTMLFCELVIKPRESVLEAVRGFMRRSHWCWEKCWGLAALLLAVWLTLSWVIQGTDSPCLIFLAILVFGVGGWNCLTGQRAITITIGGRSRSEKKD